MEAFLRITVILAFILSAAALLAVIIHTFSFGKKPLHAAPGGDWRKGVAYALGQGMMPWEKESARKHILTYFSGLMYHIGIFASLFYLISLLVPIQLSLSLLLFLKTLTASGLACGLGLLLKRNFNDHMRRISCPDDFIANGLVDLFLLFALMDMFILGFRALFYLTAISMLLYIPVGKIRHCFFFFYSRILFGRFFGRRGVYPSTQSHYKR